MERKYLTFWNVMERCDWSYEGDDDKVLRPVVDYLSKQEDKAIFEFDDLMSQLLYELDMKKLADQCRQAEPLMSDDTFLCSRCVALINGPIYYEKVKNGKEKSVWNMEFEALIYVPGKAWAQKHHSTANEYPHAAPWSIETGSNESAWK